jgi:hypothetical protein
MYGAKEKPSQGFPDVGFLEIPHIISFCHFLLKVTILMGYLFQTSSNKEGLDLYNPEYTNRQSCPILPLVSLTRNVLFGFPANIQVARLVKFTVRKTHSCNP